MTTASLIPREELPLPVDLLTKKPTKGLKTESLSLKIKSELLELWDKVASSIPFTTYRKPISTSEWRARMKRLKLAQK